MRTPTAIPVYLKDIWPSQQADSGNCIRHDDSRLGHVSRTSYAKVCSTGDTGTGTVSRRTDHRRDLPLSGLKRLDLRAQPTVLRRYATGDRKIGRPRDITGARALALLGDNVTTDHISPAGSFAPEYSGRQVPRRNKAWIRRTSIPTAQSSRQPRSHDARHVRQYSPCVISWRLGTEGGWTRYQPDGEQMTIYDASDEVTLEARVRAADRNRGQGIRDGLVTRLGGQGDETARRQVP